MIVGRRLRRRGQSGERGEVAADGFGNSTIQRGDPAVGVFDAYPAGVVDQHDVGSADGRRDEGARHEERSSVARREGGGGGELVEGHGFALLVEDDAAAQERRIHLR